jgi:hypothetical protein
MSRRQMPSREHNGSLPPTAAMHEAPGTKREDSECDASRHGLQYFSECLLDASWAACHPASCFRGACWGHTIRFLVQVRHFYTSVVSSRMATPLQ